MLRIVNMPDSQDKWLIMRHDSFDVATAPWAGRPQIRPGTLWAVYAPTVRQPETQDERIAPGFWISTAALAPFTIRAIC